MNLQYRIARVLRESVSSGPHCSWLAQSCRIDIPMLLTPGDGRTVKSVQNVVFFVKICDKSLLTSLGPLSL